MNVKSFHTSYVLTYVKTLLGLTVVNVMPGLTYKLMVVPANRKVTVVL